MAKRLGKFLVHGAFKKKSDAKRKEKSDVCNSKCFIIPRKIRGSLRHVVLERR